MPTYVLKLVRGALATLLAAAAGAAAAESLDGITIIDFPGGGDALPGGDKIVVFVSSRGNYAAIASDFAGTPRGCLAAEVPGSYSGRSISFGVEAPLDVRRHGLDTLCPRFSLNLEGDGVRVEVPPRYSRRHPIVARVPLVSLDFGAAHFLRHAVKGVRLGPVPSGDGLGPLVPARYPNQYTHRSFRRAVGIEAGKPRQVDGQAAPAEITGWPWDVLYTARYRREYPDPVSLSGLRQTMLDQFGTPSAESEDGMQWFWIYDLQGNLVRPGSDPGACAGTARYWVHQDSGGRVTSLMAPANMRDFGAWGCSLMVDVNARSSAGGVTHYAVYMVSGYAMAMSHFFQRIAEPVTVKERLDALHAVKPAIP